jgi:hypothetical protein
MYLPVMFLLTGLVAAADRGRPGAAARRSPVREIALALLVLVTVWLDYRAPHRTEGEPRWGPVVREAETACRTGRPAGRVTLTGTGADRTAILPTHRLGHWYVPVSCSKL